MTIEQAFGKAVRKLRQERELSQEALGKASQLDRTFISLIECGKKNPTLITIFQLARGLGVPAELILGEVEALLPQTVKGSTTRLTVAAAKRNKTPKPMAVIDNWIAQHALSAKETILLVEDDAITRDFLAMLLGRIGYTVLTAASGAEAIALYRDRCADISLAILDVVLPAGDGVQIAAMIHANYPAAKVVFISGYEQGALRLAGGPIPFFRKPLDPLHFACSVRAILDA